MTEPLLTISAFARAVDLAPSALRYYDEAGLLPPAEVDTQTGYRYYTPGLERRAHLIRRMREVGVPIDTMREVLDGPTDQATEILDGLAARATETAQRTASAVTDVVSSLRAGTVASRPVVTSLDGPELATALRRVSGAASSDPESPLGIVLLDIVGAELTVAATDRYWLATWSMPLNDVRVGERRVVLPVTEVDDCARWLSREDTVTISVMANDTRVMGAEDDYPLSTSVDRFPAYRLVFDAQPPARGRVTVERAELLAAVSGADSGVLVRVGHDRVTVRSQGAAEGARLDATSVGEPITLGFSAALLASALTAMAGSEVTLSYVAADRAVRLRSADQRSFTALVMPLRIDE